MNPTIITSKTKKELEAAKSELLTHYKNLVVTYEESRELYDNILTATTQTIFPCRYIVAYNDSATMTAFALYVDGYQVYITHDMSSSGYFLFDLNTIAFAAGVHFQLKAVVKWGDDSMSSVLLEKDPTSEATSYFQLKGSAFKTELKFYGGTDPH